MASCTRFSRDICRMFPQNIWKLNQHRTSLQRESLYLIHWRGGRGDGFTEKVNVANLKIAEIEIGGGISLVSILPSPH